MEEAEMDEELPLPWDSLPELGPEPAFQSALQAIRQSPQGLSAMSQGEGEALLRATLLRRTDDLPPEECANILGWVLAGEDPQAWMAALREEGCSSICGHIFKEDEMVFKCFSCATDPTCCVCAACFEGSDCAAKGHQYQMFKAGAGGCCDCGDREAWDPSGFCKKHSGPAEEDPLEKLDPQLRAVAQELLPALLLFCCRALCHEEELCGGDEEAGEYLAVLHNDNVHDINEVERAVRSAAGCSADEANALTMRAHHEGFSVVVRGGGGSATPQRACCAGADSSRACRAWGGSYSSAVQQRY